MEPNDDKKDQAVKNTTGDKLIEEACKAYGVEAKHVLSSRYDASAKEAIIVTNGGSKVRYKAGDKVEPLGEIAVTGINPKVRKVVAGKAK